MTTTFKSLGLSARMLSRLERAGYDAPTPIQAQSIPPALEGRNVIGCAATGTGKTAAFMLPLLELASERDGADSLALVLSPTRELAEQTFEYVETFGGAKAALIVGGLGMGPQITALRRRPELVIATPGRLIDHLEQGTADLSKVEILVLDEADRMLDMGFRPQLERILKRLGKRRQTLLFSATMAGEVEKFATRYVPDPVEVEIHRSGVTAERAEQQVFRVEKNEKIPLLLSLLSKDDETTLVFVRTKHRADKIAKVVERSGHKVSRIHGNRSQNQRKQALSGFRDGSYRVLVATDVAARGIDVEEIGHVINFDVPSEPEDYVHRIGRTARNQASGRATTFAEGDDRLAIVAIEKLIGRQLPRTAIPKEDPVFVEELSARLARQRDPGEHGGRTRAQRGLAPLPKESTEADGRRQNTGGGRRPGPRGTPRAGTSGRAGASGRSGGAGRSGTTGRSGTSGRSGTPGRTGTSGTSGRSETPSRASSGGGRRRGGGSR